MMEAIRHVAGRFLQAIVAGWLAIVVDIVVAVVVVLDDCVHHVCRT